MTGVYYQLRADTRVWDLSRFIGFGVGQELSGMPPYTWYVEGYLAGAMDVVSVRLSAQFADKASTVGFLTALVDELGTIEQLS